MKLGIHLWDHMTDRCTSCGVSHVTQAQLGRGCGGPGSAWIHTPGLPTSPDFGHVFLGVSNTGILNPHGSFFCVHCEEYGDAAHAWWLKCPPCPGPAPVPAPAAPTSAAAQHAQHVAVAAAMVAPVKWMSRKELEALYPDPGPPTCPACSRELSAYLDAYHGRDEWAAKHCSDCRRKGGLR